MAKTKCFSGARHLSALGIAGFLVMMCGAGTALAENTGDTKPDDRAKEVSNNFGKLLKGMGQELNKFIGSDDKADGKAAEKDRNKDVDDAGDKSDKNGKSE